MSGKMLDIKQHSSNIKTTSRISRDLYHSYLQEIMLETWVGQGDHKESRERSRSWIKHFYLSRHFERTLKLEPTTQGLFIHRIKIQNI